MGNNVLITLEQNLGEVKDKDVLATVHLGDLVEVHFVDENKALENQHLSIKIEEVETVHTDEWSMAM